MSMTLVYTSSNYESSNYDLLNSFCHGIFRTVKMVMNLYKNTHQVFLSEFLGVRPSDLKNLERDRVTLRFYQPLLTMVKQAAENRNMSMTFYLEQAVVEKLKMDDLSQRFKDEVDNYSLLKNKEEDELACLKNLLSQTLHDNERLKKTVEKYRSTNYGPKFDSFEFF